MYACECNHRHVPTQFSEMTPLWEQPIGSARRNFSPHGSAKCSAAVAAHHLSKILTDLKTGYSARIVTNL